MCKINVPAEYKVVKKKVQVSPPTVKEIEVPAEYKTVKVRKLVKPATTKTIEIPAEYKTVKVKKIVKPATDRKIPIPAEYQTITKRVKVTDGKMEWRPVLCQTNATRNYVMRIQRALKNADFNPGPIDGIIGS